MAYQSQLVVRTKDRRDSEIVERVKQMADEQGKTYSQMALELLGRGLAAGEAGESEEDGADSTPDAGADDTPEVAEEPTADDLDEAAPDDAEAEPGEAASEAADDQDETGVDEPGDPADWELAADGKQAGEALEDEALELDGSPIDDGELPDVDDPEQVASDCLEQLEAGNQMAAIQILAHFFSSAGPVAGGQVKDRLQDDLDDETYDSLLEALRQTEEYRSYRKRVIFGG